MAVGNGALGFWSAVRDVWPETTPQRDWCHKMANVLDKLPKRLRPRAKRALREAMYAATRADAETAIGAFVDEFEAKYPKATACLVEDQEALLAFFAMPAAHWLHLRTSNLIESPFATVRLRQRVTKGAGSRTKGLLMAFKLLEMAQRRWRRLNGAQTAPLGACWGPVRRWRARGTGPDGNGDSEGGCLNHVKGRSTTFDNSSPRTPTRGTACSARPAPGMRLGTESPTVASRDAPSRPGDTPSRSVDTLFVTPSTRQRRAAPTLHCETDAVPDDEAPKCWLANSRTTRRKS